jgi:hypothetical protein
MLLPLALALSLAAVRLPALALPRPVICAGRTRCATIRLDASSGGDSIDTLIDEMLAETKPEALPALLARKMDVLTTAQFLGRLEDRRATAAPWEASRLAELTELVVSFLEEVAGRLSELEPELAAAEAEADAMAAKAAEEAAKARATTEPRRRSAAAAPDAATGGRPGEMLRQGDTDNDVREKRARYRFMLEQLLDAAAVSVERLDELLRAERDRLDPGFFEHLKWEMDEQRKMKNTQLLSVLEVVVQRACVEMEGGQTELALLSSLLQTPTASIRRELYQRHFVTAPPAVQAGFLQLVSDTQLELEKRVLTGQPVDSSLLSTLRIITVEVNEYDPPMLADI